MARIRSVHPGLTSDEAFMSMTMAAKAAWAPLWMQCDDHGIFEWKPIVLKARIFPADAVDFAALLDEWIGLDCIKKVEIDGRQYGIVRNFRKYQKPKYPSYRLFDPKEGRTIPPELGEYIALNSDDSPNSGETSSKSGEDYRKCPADGVGVGVKEGEEKKKEPRAVALGDWPTDYRDQFWAMWPNKVGKPAAMSKLEAVRKSGTTWSQLTAGVERYVRTKPPDRSWLNPATFLNQRRFEDEPAEIIPFRMPGGIDMDDICPPSIYRGVL